MIRTAYTWEPGSPFKRSFLWILPLEDRRGDAIEWAGDHARHQRFEHFEVAHVHNARTPHTRCRSFTLVVTAAVDPVCGVAVGAVL